MPQLLHQKDYKFIPSCYAKRMTLIPSRCAKKITLKSPYYYTKKVEFTLSPHITKMRPTPSCVLSAPGVPQPGEDRGGSCQKGGLAARVSSLQYFGNAHRPNQLPNANTVEDLKSFIFHCFSLFLQTKICTLAGTDGYRLSQEGRGFPSKEEIFPKRKVRLFYHFPSSCTPWISGRMQRS
jgi:hypothetical protein